MKRIYYLFIGLISMAGLCISCSEEESLVASHLDSIYFLIPEDATDEESVLRRNFQKEYGIHLLYNDTLHKEYIGKDGYGNDVWDVETLDLGYYMNNSTQDSPVRIGYFQTQEEKLKALDFFKQELLPHLGKDIFPYSVLLLSSYEVFEYVSYPVYDDDWVAYPFLMGWRCMAFGLGGVDQLNNEELAAFKKKMLSDIVTSLCSHLKYEDYEEFYSYSDPYYGEDKEYLDIPEVLDDEQAREFGFLKDYYRYYYPYASTDKSEYIAAIMEMSEEEFTEIYGEYPLVMAKYKTMKNIIEGTGFKL